MNNIQTGVVQKKLDAFSKNLVGLLALKANYGNFEKTQKKLLIVEGSTDKRFLEKIKLDEIKCASIDQLFMPANDSERFGFCESHKEAIFEVVYSLSAIPSLLDVPDGLKDWSIYGMVDRDNDISAAYTRTNTLFVTDTHDLETLILSTDKQVLQRIECLITDEQYGQSLFIAYQIGVIRKGIFEVDADSPILSAIKAGTDCDFSEFCNSDNRIDLKEMIKILCSHYKLKLNKSKKIDKELLSSKQYKSLFNEEGVWKQFFSDFDTSKIPDIWQILNGHDILTALRYLNSEAARKYASNILQSGINRKFENAIIENYDYSKLKDTEMYTKMIEAGLVHEV